MSHQLSFEVERSLKYLLHHASISCLFHGCTSIFRNTYNSCPIRIISSISIISVSDSMLISRSQRLALPSTSLLPTSQKPQSLNQFLTQPYQTPLPGKLTSQHSIKIAGPRQLLLRLMSMSASQNSETMGRSLCADSPPSKCSLPQAHPEQRTSG
jgi:hypothetical protein